jgi:hypothetical protein
VIGLPGYVELIIFDTAPGIGEAVIVSVALVVSAALATGLQQEHLNKQNPGRSYP